MVGVAHVKGAQTRGRCGLCHQVKGDIGADVSIFFDVGIVPGALPCMFCEAACRNKVCRSGRSPP